MSKFNWSILDRDNIIEFMMLIAPELVNQKLTADIFHKKISNHVKKYLPIRTRKSFNVLVEQDQVWVGGTYYSDWDREKKKCIELVFEYSYSSEYIQITNRRFKSVCVTVADTILHEIIHMRQYRRRKFKILPDYESNADKTKIREEQSYLGCSDEIDAYSFNIACELNDKFLGNYKQIINYLNENQKGKRRRSNSWRIYLKAFEHNHNHPIIQRVKKKVVRYLPFAEIGKPYKNKDWINW